MRLDFSEFHPLDHPLSRCHGYPGGWRRHLQYRWVFQWREQVVAALAHVVGRHVWQGVGYRDRHTGEFGYFVVCTGDGCRAKPDPRTAARVIGNMRNNRDFQALLSNDIDDLPS